MLDRTDVLVMWDYSAGATSMMGERNGWSRVLGYRLNLLALYLAHWTKPFVRLMQERAKADAVLQIPEAERATAHWTYLDNNPIGQGVKPETPLSPFLEKDRFAAGADPAALRLSCLAR